VLCDGSTKTFKQSSSTTQESIPPYSNTLTSIWSTSTCL